MDTTTTREMVECPDCDGKGRQRGHNDLGEWEDDVCSLCMGDGEVPEECVR